jgi:hypothetical protein
MHDLLLIEDDLFSIEDVGQRHMAVGGITKAQFLACLAQAPYLGENTPNTRLFSVLGLPFQREGLRMCGLTLPPEIKKRALVDEQEDGLRWRTSICPAGTFTDLHYDHHGCTQLMVGISTRKLWLIWPPTPKNLEWWSGFRARTPTGTEALDAIKHMERLTLHHQQGLNAFFLPPYHLHAALTFETSAHCVVTFWDIPSWEDFSRVGLEWEFLAQDILDALDQLEVLSNTRKKSKGLVKWVMDMRTKLAALKLT